MVANKYAFLQITRRRFLNEWEAFKKVISRRNIRRRITIPLTLSNLKLLRRITRTENILHRNFTRRQVAIQNRVASNIGISQSTFRDRKSGSAGMPRQISYAVFCLKKKNVREYCEHHQHTPIVSQAPVELLDLLAPSMAVGHLLVVIRSHVVAFHFTSDFLFICFLTHDLALHSFPTRRSSDLERKTSFIEISRGGKLPYKTGSPAISV